MGSNWTSKSSNVLNFTTGTKMIERIDYFGDQDYVNVAVLYCNGEEVWSDDGDEAQYSGDTAADVVIEMLRQVLNEPTRVQ